MRQDTSLWFGSAGLAGRSLQLGGARPLPRRRPTLGQINDFAAALQRRGPILPIQIGLPSAATASGVKGTMEEIQALVDTGASITAINRSAAERLGLIPTGSIQVGGVTGVATMPVYGAKIVMPEPGYTFDPVQIAGANLNAPDFDVLLGRNLLCSMMMSYDGMRGQFALVK